MSISTTLPVVSLPNEAWTITLTHRCGLNKEHLQRAKDWFEANCTKWAYVVTELCEDGKVHLHALFKPDKGSKQTSHIKKKILRCVFKGDKHEDYKQVVCKKAHDQEGFVSYMSKDAEHVDVVLRGYDVTTILELRKQNLKKARHFRKGRRRVTLEEAPAMIIEYAEINKLSLNSKYEFKCVVKRMARDKFHFMALGKNLKAIQAQVLLEMGHAQYYDEWLDELLD